MSVRTGILIVTYNSAEHIRTCLEALPPGNEPVLVIDNASTDGTVSAARSVSLKTESPVNVLANETNRGFAGAVNQGFRYFADRTDRVLLLNPDVQLSSTLRPMETACDAAGLAGGCLTDDSGSAQTGFTVRRFPTPAVLLFETLGVNRLWPGNPVNRRYRCLDLDLSREQTVDQPAGALLMIRTDVWQRLGGMDEDFHPVWFEDVDFCFRAAQAGFRAAYVPQVRGTHAGGHSVLQIPEFRRRRCWYASLLRYSRKHFGGVGHSLVAGGILAAGLARMVGAQLRSSREEAMLYRSIVRLVLNRMGKAETTNPENTEVSAGAADVRSCNARVGTPSIENTERTLKRLHARS